VKLPENRLGTYCGECCHLCLALRAAPRPGGLLLTAPMVVRVLLRLLRGCGDAAERLAALTALSRLLGANSFLAFAVSLSTYG